MDLDFSEDEEAFRTELRQFLVEALPSGWTGIFHGGDSLEVSGRVTRAMAARGWLTQLWPREFGGLGASIWRQAVLQEELWAHHEPRGGQYMGVNWVGPALMAFGTEAQCAAYLPSIAAGEVQWAQLFSEPDAGSDLANISTRAELDGDEFVINGEKIWTSYADYASVGFLVARSAPGSRRRQGISVLIVAMDTPGIEVRPIRTPLGVHKLNSVVFRDVRVPSSSLLGQLNDGWSVATTALSFERTGAARYARTTRMLGLLERRAPAACADNGEALAMALAYGRTAELINYSVMSIRDRGEMPTWEASAARVHNTLYEQRVATLIERVIGEQAMVTADDPEAPAGGELEEFARIAPTAAVAAGTYEVQMGIIAGRGLGLERAS
jgi:alkylation response protein AidB-like acyl-CoA dehydrogenase